MGVHNRITKEKFIKIKAACKGPAQDLEIAKKFGVGPTTARNIRLSKDYQAYLERVFRFHGNPKGGRTGSFKQPGIIPYKPDAEAWERLELSDDGPVNPRLWALWVVLPVIIFAVLLVTALVAIVSMAVGGAR